MKNFSFSPTPVEYLPYFSDKYGVELYVKRDDLFPSALGGSKSRMLQYILYPLVQKGIKTIVTAGGPCSNFNRAIALLCAKYGFKLKLISYTDNLEEYKTSLNNYLVNLTGCEYIYCKKTEVSQTIGKVMNESDDLTYFIYGGGKSLAGFYAYYEAIEELSMQLDKVDDLFVACGTGTTLTGICAGMQRYFPETVVHAISIARNYELEFPVLTENMNQLNSFLGTNYDFSNLRFYDKYISGGYGETCVELLAVIRECISCEGMVLDPTYVGKAFYGMTSVLSTGKYIGKKILFWNTGGLINLLSQKDLFA